ncbi:MAG: cardiolipin synthase [Myxococcota bacterium]|jgi:cardiolipin synthase
MATTTWIMLGLLVAQLVVIFGVVLQERRQPVATIAWVLAVLLIPFLGAFLYLLFGVRPSIKRNKRALLIAERTAQLLADHEVMRKASQGIPDALLEPRTQALVTLGVNSGDAVVSDENHGTILPGAGPFYTAMLEAIADAKHHIHVCFYIIQPDATGRTLREALVEQARRGVEVRVLCDALGSHKLPGHFWEPLTDVGGRSAEFSPIRLAPRFRRRDHVNYRNHRKIIVIDGRVGMTGGINVGREYLGLDPTIGHWRDSHIALTGPAVLKLQQVFIEDWLASTQTLLEDAAYFPDPPQTPAGNAIVQIVASGPDRPWAVIHRIHALAIANARERLWITNPYYVPDRVIQNAIVTAALSGVDVRLLLPKKSDSRLVDYASRAYYAELLEAGVKIYHYDRGFLHAKTVVIDRWLGTVGSANMDIRSFHLNYELNAFFYSADLVDELATQFEHDLKHTRRVSPDWVRRQSWWRRLAHAIAGLGAPLL